MELGRDSSQPSSQLEIVNETSEVEFFPTQRLTHKSKRASLSYFQLLTPVSMYYKTRLIYSKNKNTYMFILTKISLPFP